MASAVRWPVYTARTVPVMACFLGDFVAYVIDRCWERSREMRPEGR
jgi:hypothetical protein